MSTALATIGKTYTATGGYLFKTVNRKTRYIHIDIAEKAIGRPLPKGAEVHHVNGNPNDNTNSNLVICPSHEYHSLLHQREMALMITGKAHLRLCTVCGIYDDPIRMNPRKKQFYHAKCNAFQSKQRRAKIRSQKELSK